MRVIGIVLPIFTIIVLAYVAARRAWIHPSTGRALNQFVFYFAVPCMLIDKMSHVELPVRVPWQFVIAYYGGAYLSFGLGMWIARRVFARGTQAAGIAGFGSAYTNTVNLGIPLILSAFGDAGAPPLFTMLALHSLLLFPLITIVIERSRGRADEARRAPIRALRGLALNPLILSLACGVTLNLASIELPATLSALLSLVGQAAPACALFSLGAALAAYRLSDGWRESFAIVAVKNLVHPIAVGSLAFIVFRLEPLWAQVAMLIAALPTGINVYVFAEHYGVGESLAAKTVVLSTAVSVLTLSLLIWRFVPA